MNSVGIQLPVEEHMIWVLNKIIKYFCLEPTPDLEEEESDLCELIKSRSTDYLLQMSVYF